MEKTEMMLKYEQETGKRSVNSVTDGIHGVCIDVWHWEYLAWLEAKATAYDRVMSGGDRSLKEVANFLGRTVAMDADGQWHWFAFKPTYIVDRWWGVDGSASGIIPFKYKKHISPEDSLTLPDGWEKKQ